MQDTWVLGTISLIFGLLSSLQGVNANKTVSTCDILNCSKGFRCCENGCCLERKIWNSENDPLRIPFSILLVIIPVLWICALVWYICYTNREPQHDIRSADHMTPPEQASIASLESIWVTSLDPPPPYSQVVLEPSPTESPPPYSLRPQGHTGQMGWNVYATI